ncbi:MAG: hypothetical protein EOM14_08805, partial [Clostridia bacterium]|nr:hypothetical protein [Clostridia bacterium]
MFYINNIEYSDLLIFSIIVDVVMYVFLYKDHSRQSHSSKLFLRLILATIFVASCEMLGWLVAVPDYNQLRAIHYFSNALFLSLNTLPAAFGLRYLDYKIFSSEKKNKRNFLFYLAPVYLNIGFMIINIFFDGFLFSVDTANQYHRGVATYIGNAFTFLIVAIAVFNFYRNRQMITGRITQAIVSMTLLP